MCYLSDSRQIHQCEVDDVRRKYLQMNGFIADPLQREKKRCSEYVKFVFFSLLAVNSDDNNIVVLLFLVLVALFSTVLGVCYSPCLCLSCIV